MCDQSMYNMDEVVTTLLTFPIDNPETLSGIGDQLQSVKNVVLKTFSDGSIYIIECNEVSEYNRFFSNLYNNNLTRIMYQPP